MWCSATVRNWRAFPHLNVGDIRLASLGRSGEGWFNNTGLMFGFCNKAREQGGEFIKDEVVGIGREGDRVTPVTFASGIRSSRGLTARMARLDIPVEPRYVGIAPK